VSTPRKPSRQTATILTALAADPGSWHYGYDLLQKTGLQAGSLYPILMRLADRDQVESRWEPSHLPGRPPRHMYRLTEAGLALAAELRPAVRPVPSLRLRPGLEGAS
jgi:PadR family transcriptional regulator, regulatory protein PadR